MLYAVLLVVECCFLRETLYPRALVIAAEEATLISNGSQEPTHIQGLNIKRTKELGYFSFQKIPGVVHPKPWATITRYIKMWASPNIVVGVMSYLFLHYWWIVPVLTMEPAAYEDYSLVVHGLFFIGLIVRTVVTERVCSSRLSDWLIGRLARSNGGVRIPKMRLWLGYMGAVLTSIGLLIWGSQSIDNGTGSLARLHSS